MQNANNTSLIKFFDSLSIKWNKALNEKKRTTRCSEEFRSSQFPPVVDEFPWKTNEKRKTKDGEGKTRRNETRGGGRVSVLASSGADTAQRVNAWDGNRKSIFVSGTNLESFIVCTSRSAANSQPSRWCDSLLWVHAQIEICAAIFLHRFS